MLREARDSLSLVRCAFTGVIYQPLAKRATQRNSRVLCVFHSICLNAHSAPRISRYV